MMISTQQRDLNEFGDWIFEGVKKKINLKLAKTKKPISV